MLTQPFMVIGEGRGLPGVFSQMLDFHEPGESGLAKWFGFARIG